jgi:hypothetical protein
VRTGRVVDRAESPAWARTQAVASVVVATHDRAEFLPGLFDALAAQTVDVEVVVADDGSTDGTWDWLQQHLSASPLPVLALRLEHTGGPSLPRNTAAAHARADVLAITDDDCLPEPGWAAALVAALAGGAAVAQGRTRPAEAAHGPWDRAVDVAEPSGLFETCNLAFPRERFVTLGGFPLYDVLGDLPRGFGEDAVFGARAARTGGATWAGDAVVVHRWIPTTFAGHLDGVARLSAFPWLVREVPEVAALLKHGVFLSRRTMQYDAAVAGLLAALLARNPLPAVAALPWLRHRFASARRRGGRPVAVRLAQEAVADTVGFVALVKGSVRHRRPVL